MPPPKKPPPASKLLDPLAKFIVAAVALDLSEQQVHEMVKDMHETIKKLSIERN
jgi:hypothetical protein